MSETKTLPDPLYPYGQCPWCKGDGRFGHWPSESAKYLHHVEKYLGPEKNVIEVASGGWPIVPHSLQVELPLQKFFEYTGGRIPPPIQWKGYANDLPFKSDVADVLISSHYLEDVPVEGWMAQLKEWVRVIKKNGILIVMLPDKELWLAALKRGQTPNYGHKHESEPGELSAYAPHLNLQVIEDRLTENFPGDYNILFTAKKL